MTAAMWLVRVTLISLVLLALLGCALLPGAEARLREGECEGQRTQPALLPSRTSLVLSAAAVSSAAAHRCALRCLSRAVLAVRHSVLCAAAGAVCLRRVGEMSASLSSLSSASAIEDGIRRLCRSYTDKADQRFCYYIGGSDDAATSLLRTVSGALINHLPPVKVCEKLKAADGQICAVKYEAPPKAIGLGPRWT